MKGYITKKLDYDNKMNNVPKEQKKNVTYVIVKQFGFFSGAVSNQYVYAYSYQHEN